MIADKYKSFPVSLLNVKHWWEKKTIRFVLKRIVMQMVVLN